MVQNFNSTIPVVVTGVKCYVDPFLHSTCVPVRISINKLDLVLNRIVASLADMFKNAGGLGTSEFYISVLSFAPLWIGLPVFMM